MRAPYFAVRHSSFLKDHRSHRINDRRLRQPEPVLPYEGLYYVQQYGDACPQQALTLPNGLDLETIRNIEGLVNSMYDRLRATNEDCREHLVFLVFPFHELNDSRGLTINVVKPASAKPKSRLPVVVVGTYLRAPKMAHR